MTTQPNTIRPMPRWAWVTIGLLSALALILLLALLVTTATPGVRIPPDDERLYRGPGTGALLHLKDCKCFDGSMRPAPAKFWRATQLNSSYLCPLCIQPAVEAWKQQHPAPATIR